MHQYSNGKSNLIFMPMIHIGKPTFYADVKKKVDSLRQDGYIILYEGLALDYINNDSLKIDKYLRKFKKITGVYVSPYTNKKNKTTGVPKIKGIVTQTNENTGIDTDKDIRADFDLINLIDLFEKEKGEITLNDCDLKADLNSKYKCSRIDQAKNNYLMVVLRNRLILQKINEANSKKTLLIYGAGHQYGVEKLLKEQDSTWKYVYTSDRKPSK
ncbi:hypothetical protein HYN49_02870 [Flavobacterium pallidum]|uniref:TraB/GumN family protein n=2 Tax=Flavobacterium pallidum TaxID=2172098 RepID=A0A2S1SEV2_9FLAO|nr:hypothetical protein HYN49_02870 [Flavobacterium pallidum]